MIKYKCLSCNKDLKSDLRARLRKNWETLNETALFQKEKLHSNLNMEDITDAYYIHAKSVSKDFKVKDLSEYLDLYLKNYALLLADVFQKLQKNTLNIFFI